jgi:HxlR-like helix-turn-helix.
MTLTTEKLLDCIENPVKTKIILTMQKGPSTTQNLLKTNPDIPQATLYRALKSMESAGIIEIVSENKVRAIVEKTYAISKEFANLGESIVKNNDGEAYFKLFSTFVIELLKRFESYAKNKEIDIAGDGSSFTAVPLYGTAEEFVEYSKKIAKILEPAMTRKSEDQKLHTMVTIITPPAEDGTEVQFHG